MSTYVIISQIVLPSGATQYTVQLNADNGYSEVQRYVGTLDTLQEAQDHFNTSIMEAQAAQDVTP